MNHLPNYWCLKIDKEHPLWERFCDSIKENYPSVNNNSNWTYIGFDGTGGAGYNQASGADKFCKQTKLITLEEYFQIQYEIY